MGCGTGGLNTLKQLRERGVSLPAILITSHPTRALRDAAARAGAPILEKPLDGESLADVIDHLLVAAKTQNGGRTAQRR